MSHEGFCLAVPEPCTPPGTRSAPCPDSGFLYGQYGPLGWCNTAASAETLRDCSGLGTAERVVCEEHRGIAPWGSCAPSDGTTHSVQVQQAAA